MYFKNSLLVCVGGTVLTDIERTRIRHPLVAGIILFSRNFESSAQLKALIKAIRNSRTEPLLIAVDHEGGRVQRFKTDEFTHLPAMGRFYDFFRGKGEINEVHNNQPLSTFVADTLKKAGWLMASECRSHDIDVSFAPVLDIEQGSDVIGDRSFNEHADIVSRFAQCFIEGMKEAGMPSVGKHFPGHGSTKEDSHLHTPVDNREFKSVMENDGIVFAELNQINALDAIMPAHIVFDKVDSLPVGFSKVWLQEILRKQLGFNGCIFSDDLSMVGAGLSKKSPISYAQRLELAIQAGCDITLICNQPNDVDLLLNSISYKSVTNVGGGNAFLRSVITQKLNNKKNDVSEELQIIKIKDLMEDIKHYEI